MNPRALVQVLLLIALSLSACSPHHRMGYPHRSMEAPVEEAKEEVSALIDRVVGDPERAARVKAIVDQIVAEARESRQQNRQFHGALYELNVDYHAEPEAFLKIVDEMNARRMQAAGNILRLRFEMKGLMSEEEWKAFTNGLAELRGRYQGQAKGKS